MTPHDSRTANELNLLRTRLPEMGSIFEEIYTPEFNSTQKSFYSKQEIDFITEKLLEKIILLESRVQVLEEGI